MKITYYFFLLPFLVFISCVQQVTTELEVETVEPELIEESEMVPNVIILKGNYYGKNVIIHNPFSESGIGFCVDKIMVNGEYAACEVASAQIEIDLSSFGDMETPDIEVEIHHSSGCLPKILNPNVLDYPTDTVGNIVAPQSI
ncbi:MAG: hypothetical protein ACI9J3_001162 [Parvicellaceae bacterium]|jgi:hypothetical protein